jgi:hypothetical protein
LRRHRLSHSDRHQHRRRDAHRNHARDRTGRHAPHFTDTRSWHIVVPERTRWRRCFGACKETLGIWALSPSLRKIETFAEGNMATMSSKQLHITSAIGRPGGWYARAARSQNGDLDMARGGMVTRAAALRDNLQRQLDEHLTEAEAVRQDARYSSMGKRSRMAELAKARLAALDETRRKGLDVVRERVATLRQDLAGALGQQAVPDAMWPAIVEIWRRLPPDNLQLWDMVSGMDARDPRNALVLMAVSQMPKSVFPQAPNAQQQLLLLDARLQALTNDAEHGPKAAELSTLLEASAELDSVAAAIETTLLDASGSRADPIAQMAGQAAE